MLLLAKAFRSQGRHSIRGLGNVTLAFLFGVGAALAVGGSLMGTLYPQAQAAFVSLNPRHYAELVTEAEGPPFIYVSNAVLLTIGTISTLLYFTYTTGHSNGQVGTRGRWLDGTVRVARGFGKVFLMFTLGALFAVTSLSYLSLAVDRIRFIIETLWALLFAA
jgi:hypothetical protein